MEGKRLQAFYSEPIMCSYAEDDDPGAGGDPAPEPEPVLDPAPEPEPQPEPPAEPEPEKAPAWAIALQESVKELQGRIPEQEPEPEPEDDLLAGDDDKPLTRGEMKALLARATDQTTVSRAQERVIEYAETALKADYPDLVTINPTTGQKSIKKEYEQAVIAFFNQGDPGHKFEAALRRLFPKGQPAAPRPAPEDVATLDSPSPAPEDVTPSYKDARSLKDAGRMAQKGG